MPMVADSPFHIGRISRIGMLSPKRPSSPAKAAFARILALPGLEAAYFPYIPGLTLPFVGTTNASSWPDSSGKGRPLLQATGAAQPLINADGSLTFDGVIQFLKTLAFTLNQPATIYLRLKQITWTNNDVFVDGNVAFASFVGTQTATPTIRIFAGGSVPNNSLAVNVMGSLAAVFNGPTSVLRVNADTQTGGAGAASLAGLTLGGAADGTNPGNVKVAMVAAFSNAQSGPAMDSFFVDMQTLTAGIT